MKSKIITLTAVIVTVAATSASAATRLIGAGCCPFCK